MAYEEVSRVDVTEIIRRWQAGATIRGLARASGLSRNTIKKYILAAKSAGLTNSGPVPTEHQIVSLVQLNVAGRHPAAVPTEGILGPWADHISRWLKEERLELTRIQELPGKNNCVEVTLLSAVSLPAEGGGRITKARSASRIRSRVKWLRWTSGVWECCGIQKANGRGWHGPWSLCFLTPGTASSGRCSVSN
jgi:hypothetical protein